MNVEILIQIAIGSLLIIITTLIHALGMALAIKWLLSPWRKRLASSSIWIRSFEVGVFVLVMFITTLVEAGIWAITYLGIGALSSFETAFYFSTVTYTTLGFGDVVLDQKWRLLSSFEAANGIIMFGWTTALIVIALYHISTSLKRVDKPG